MPIALAVLRHVGRRMDETFNVTTWGRSPRPAHHTVGPLFAVPKDNRRDRSFLAHQTQYLLVPEVSVEEKAHTRDSQRCGGTGTAVAMTPQGRNNAVFFAAELAADFSPAAQCLQQLLGSHRPRTRPPGKPTQYSAQFVFVPGPGVSKQVLLCRGGEVCPIECGFNGQVSDLVALGEKDQYR